MEMFMNIVEPMNLCQRTSNMLTKNLAKLVTTLLKEPFRKWGLDFIGPVKPISRMSNNQYILVTTNYATKWVTKARTFYTNTIIIITHSVATLAWPSVGVKPNTWKSWRFGVLRDSRMFRARQQGAKHLALVSLERY